MAAAGTVVTEIATPTSAPDFADVSESTPATPARNATTNENRSGCQMKAVFGRSPSTWAWWNSPAASMKRLKPVVSSSAAAKPATSAISDRHARRGARCTSAVQTPASGPNSGPTAIAPTIRIALSSTTPQAAIIVATVRNTR